MAQLHTGSGRAKSMGGHVAMRPDKVGMGDNGDNNIAHTPTSPSSSLALSRFEFEPGKGNEGTKVLMVEWQLSAMQGTQPGTHRLSGDSNPRSGRSPGDTAGNNWSVTWEGKDDHNVLAASDNTGGTGTDSTERRMYFLLPPGATIPPLINIHCVRHGSTTAVHSDEIEGDDTTPIELWTRPMPAIYPASLGPEAKQAGWRGVLHGLWAKHKLAGLAAEIEAEMRANSESIGLQIALQEHCWVSAHFGNGEPKAPTESSPCPPHPAKDIARVVMPRSPIGGKLGEKLKGLRLATSPAELAAALHGEFPFFRDHVCCAHRLRGAFVPSRILTYVSSLFAFFHAPC